MRIRYFLITVVLVTVILYYPLGSVKAGALPDCMSYSNASDQIKCLTDLITQLTQQRDQIQAQQSTTQTWCHAFNTYLETGSINATTNGEVSYLQTALTKQGFNVRDAEGVFGDSTASAVIKFQAKYQIKRTGAVGPVTRAKLNSLYGCGVTPTSNSTLVPIQPSITIISPNGGETWKVGETHNITWTSSGVNNVYVGLVQYDNANNILYQRPLYTDDSGNVVSIPASSGNFSWTITGEKINLAPGTKSKIMINDYDNPNSYNNPKGVIDWSDDYFSIVAPPCTPNWTCGWGQCINGSQSQVAIDSNKCGITTGQITCPALARTCTPCIQLGLDGNFVASQSGTLMLYFNDNTMFFGDNAGFYSVTINGTNVRVPAVSPQGIAFGPVTSGTTYTYSVSTNSRVQYDGAGDVADASGTVYLRGSPTTPYPASVADDKFLCPSLTAVSLVGKIIPSGTQPSITISGSDGIQTNRSDLTANIGDTFTISGVPQNLQGLSYYSGSSYPTSGYYNMAWFFAQSFGDNNSCRNNGSSINEPWTTTCTAKVAGSSTFYIEIYANGQSYKSNTITVTIPSSIQPSITVTSPPNSGVQWHSDVSQTVTWTSNVSTGNVGLFLTDATNGGGCLLGQASVDSGSMTVTPSIGYSCPNQSMTLSKGNYYLYLMYPFVSVNNPGGSYGDSSGQSIPVALTGPVSSITIISPNGGENLTIGYSQDIKYSYTGPQAIGNFALYKEGSNNRCLLGTNSLPSTKFTFNLNSNINCDNGEHIFPGKYKVEALALPIDSSVMSARDMSDDYFNIIAP